LKVVQINSTCTKGSTGKICMEISKLLTENGVENYILHAQDDADYSQGIAYTGRKNIMFQAAKAQLFGNYGFNSVASTRRLIKHLEWIKPDIVHLHNIHSHECNLEILINYLKKEKIKILWTFHDCWAFTGYCSHYDYMNCNKWKDGCHSCSQYRKKSLFFDRSSELYNRKKELAKGLDITIFTPSKWLSEQVGMSFFKSYPRFVINNGIDLNVFCPKENSIKEKYNIKGNLVLGVSYKWDESKGLDVFSHLAKRLDENYTIMLVGTDKETEKSLPPEIVTLRRTHSREELSEVYSAADVFVNPTRADTYPTVNMEAIACGTPVVTFNSGGSPEIIDETCGIVINCDDIDGLENAVRTVCEKSPFKTEDLLKKANGFDKKECFNKYLEIYNRLLSEC